MLDKHQGPHRLLKMTDLTSRAALIEYYLSCPDQATCIGYGFANDWVRTPVRGSRPGHFS
jgi:hypothetical protein